MLIPSKESLLAALKEELDIAGLVLVRHSDTQYAWDGKLLDAALGVLALKIVNAMLDEQTKRAA